MKNKTNIVKSLILSCAALLSLFCAVSCTTTKNLAPVSPISDDIQWLYLQDGIDYFCNQKQLVVCKIDLSKIRKELFYSPVKGDFSDWQDGIDGLKLAKEKNLTVAVNTIPFIQKNRLPFSKQKPYGLIIQNEKNMSEANSRYAGVRFFYNEKTKNLNCRIYDDQSTIPSKGTIYATGGYWVILDGKEILPFKDIKDYRTAIATSPDESTLYLLYGKNLSYPDCARIFYSLGASKAMEFDGGSSSFIYIKDNLYLKPPLSRKVFSIIGF